jgi:hypothetical protein
LGFRARELAGAERNHDVLVQRDERARRRVRARRSGGVALRGAGHEGAENVGASSSGTRRPSAPTSSVISTCRDCAVLASVRSDRRAALKTKKPGIDGRASFSRTRCSAVLLEPLRVDLRVCGPLLGQARLVEDRVDRDTRARTRRSRCTRRG